MIVIFIRTLITFATLIVVMRLMGKRQIGEMQPFEFIVTLIIADLACIPMTDISIPLTYGLVSILALFLLHQILALIEQSGDVAKKIISGKPSIVINKNGVDFLELKKNNMGIDDLIESLRSAGHFSLDEVDYAIFESNGKLSVFKGTNEVCPSSIPLLIINQGKISKRNLSILKADQSDILSFLKDNSTNLKDVEVMTVDGNGRTYIKKKKRKFEILTYPLDKETKW